MRQLVVAVSAAVVVLTGCGTSQTETLTLHIDIVDDMSTYTRGCTQGDGRYREIHQAMPILVTAEDWNAPLMGRGMMVSGEQTSGGNCRFTGYVKDLPRDSTHNYKIELGDSGFELTYSLEELEAKDWTLDVALMANMGDWTVESDAGEPTVKLGESFEDRGFEFVVNSVNCGEPTAGEEKWFVAAKGQLCRLGITMTNKSDQALEPPMSHKLIDSTGREVDTDWDSMYAEINTTNQVGGDSPWTTPLGPGEQITADVLFDVPWDFEPVHVEIHGVYEMPGDYASPDDPGVVVDLLRS